MFKSYPALKERKKNPNVVRVKLYQAGEKSVLPTDRLQLKELPCAAETWANKLVFEFSQRWCRPDAQTTLCQLIKPDLLRRGRRHSAHSFLLVFRVDNEAARRFSPKGHCGVDATKP